MNRRILRIPALMLVCLGLVTSCGSDRPVELSMGEAKICQLIPEVEFKPLRIVGKSQPRDLVPVLNLDGTTCVYRVRNQQGAVVHGNLVKVSAITNTGIGRWISDDNEDTGFKDVAPIRGFRTIQVWDYSPPDPHDPCEFYVDVADGQALRIMVGSTIDDDDPPTCKTARRFAEVVMQTLIRQAD